MFQYEPYDNTRSIGQIIELMMAGPHAAAQAARASGEARAHAMEIAGQNSAQLGMTLGNIASGTAQQIAHQFSPEAKALQEQRQAMADERKYNVSERQRLTQQRGAVDSLMRESIITDPVTGIVTYDRPTLMSGMTKLNLAPDEQEKWLKLLDSSDAAVKTAKEAQNGALKQIAGIVDATGNDSSVFENEVKRAIANGIISERMAAPYLDAARRDPSHIAKVTSAILGKKPDLMAVPAGSSVIDKNADPGAPPLYQAPPKEPTPKSLQSKSVQVDGKSVEAVFDPATGKLSVNGQDVTDRAKPIPPASLTIRNEQNAPPPGDFGKTGDDFLATIPVQWRQTVKKIARYEEDPTKSVAMRSGNRDKVMQWVNQYNPAYKADEFAVRAPTRKAFTTGTQGQQINAINTAVGHIDQLTSVADQLQNGGFTPGNKAWNSVRTMFGSDKVTNFDTLKDALAGEVSSILSKGSATVSGIQDAKDKIHAANSPAQLAGYVKTLIPVMGSKLAALDYQYHQAMGEDDTFSALSPETKTILAKHGFDPAHPTISPNEKTGTKIVVMAPDGSKHEFDTQAQADQFKRLAGLK